MASVVSRGKEASVTREDLGSQKPWSKSCALTAFAVMTLAPAGLLGLGAALGGVTAALALVFIGALVWSLDRFSRRAAPFVPEADEFPAATWLSYLLALTHLALLPVMVWALAGGATLSLTAAVLLYFGLSLWVGQVSNSNAHELIHRPSRLARALGVAVYASIGYGHHASAHRLVHHRFVATPEDPNSALKGESFYRFAWRAWPREYLAGLRAERELSRRGQRRRLHPYWIYSLGTLAAVAVAVQLGGVKGGLVWLAVSVYAQAQLLLSDYVQHYGLRRRFEAGRYERVGPQHSWDAVPWASSALMLNAPRHADHHAHPLKPYPALELPAEALRLPFSLPVMAGIALWPRLWFRLMDRRLPQGAGNPPNS